MDAVIVLTSVLLVPIVAGGLLARHTSWYRSVIALVAGAPLPLILLGFVLVEYLNALAKPPERCGLGCGLDRSLAPLVMMVALGGMVIAVAIAFLTATIVRRRR